MATGSAAERLDAVQHGIELRRNEQRVDGGDERVGRCARRMATLGDGGLRDEKQRCDERRNGRGGSRHGGRGYSIFAPPYMNFVMVGLRRYS